jgi:hypothetical protein
MRCDGSSSLSPSSISAVYAKMNLLLKKGDAVLEFGLPVHHASNADYGVCTAQSIDTVTTHVFRLRTLTPQMRGPSSILGYRSVPGPHADSQPDTEAPREALTVVADGVATPKDVDRIFQSVLRSAEAPFRLMAKVGLCWTSKSTTRQQMGTHLKAPAHCSAYTSRRDGLAKKQAGASTTIIPSASKVVTGPSK